MATKAENLKAEIEAEFAATASGDTEKAEKTEDTESQTTENMSAEKMVKIILPLTRENTADVFVSVNERQWLIKRGEEVEVPECVAEVIRNQERALRKAIDYITSVEQKSE